MTHPENGVTRCPCGCKYWDNDGRCVDCGERPLPPSYPTGVPYVDTIASDLSSAFSAANGLDHCQEAADVQNALAMARRALDRYTRGDRSEVAR